MKKLLLIPTIFLLLIGCSYKPVLLNNQYDFQLVNINFTGDNEINKIIQKDLIRKSNGTKKYSISFSTKKNRETLSSNEKGDPIVYKLNVDTFYTIIKDKKIKLERNISKQITYNNINDKFELSQYEENIINNLAQNISADILMSITTVSE